MTEPFAEMGMYFSAGRRAALQNSQENVVLHPWPEVLPNRLSGTRLGGGSGIAIAQAMCPWWIEGMLRLVKAIEDAPEPKDPARLRKERAGRLARRAVADGVLTYQPCEACGETSTLAHHDDYTRPLDIRWLCRKHHAQHHAAIGSYSGPRRSRGAA